MNFTTLISEEYDKELNFALPIVFGLKSNLSTNLIFAVEIVLDIPLLTILMQVIQ